MLFYMHVVGFELEMHKHEAHCDWIESHNNESKCEMNLNAVEDGLWV